MNDGAGHQELVKASAAQIVEHLSQPTPELAQVISAATGVQTATEIEQHRTQLLAGLTRVRDNAIGEISQDYVHYASRVGIVGAYQSVLSALFSEIPALQGYGDRNPVWVTTLLEQGGYKLKSFFQEIHELRGAKKSLLQATIEAWKEIKFVRAPYPPGAPTTLRLDETAKVALLADWGGDNPAAKQIASIVKASKPKIAIHLGDIYYGGVKEECKIFLRNWPLQLEPAQPGKGISPSSSLALNGNHEMYSGGESFFNVVLPAFHQPQPFFCLEGEHWRIIGLDTAYLGGRLKPRTADDVCMQVQWDWLVNLLKTGPKLANILLTHHQPVSAHSKEFSDSVPLRDDMYELLNTEGIGQDAIFGWFFGHEHRCTVYDDHATQYNARLIGSGCIPHEIQRETTCDSGCTPFVWVSNRGEDGSTEAAISQYAELQFQGQYLHVNYVDERGTSLGHEMWDAAKGRLNGVPFKADQTTYAQS